MFPNPKIPFECDKSEMVVSPLSYFNSMVLYQNPDDFPPGGFLTLIVARGPSLSNSSAQKR